MKYKLKSQVKKALAVEALELLGVSHYDTTLEPFSVFHPLATEQTLVDQYSVSDLRKLRDLTALLQETRHTADRLTLSHVASTNRPFVLHALYEKREWIVKNPHLLTPLQHFVNVLDTTFSPTEEDDTEMVLWFSEVLAVAYHRITMYGYPEESHLKGIAMLKNTEFVALLLNNVSKVNELLDYRQERGMDQTAVMEPHDEEDFADYLAQHAVRSGWL